MQVILQITAGPSVGRKIRVHPDRISQCGKSIKADIGFPYDAAMEDLHYEISFPEGAGRIRPLSGAVETLVNGKPLQGPQPLNDQDEITAGRTTVVIRIDGNARSLPGVAAGVAGIAAAEPKLDTALVFTKPLELSDEAKQRLDEKIKTPAYIETLAAAGLVDDAIKVLAYFLPHRLSVWWAWEAVQTTVGEQLKPDDLMAFNAAHEWVATPTDPVRRAAFQCAENGRMRGPGCWLAVAAFWSGDSLSPANLPKVPPAPTLCGQAVSVALTLAAILVARPKQTDTKKAWIKRGLELSKVPEIAWPKPSRADPAQPPSRTAPVA